MHSLSHLEIAKINKIRPMATCHHSQGTVGKLVNVQKLAWNAVRAAPLLLSLLTLEKVTNYSAFRWSENRAQSPGRRQWDISHSSAVTLSVHVPWLGKKKCGKLLKIVYIFQDLCWFWRDSSGFLNTLCTGAQTSNAKADDQVCRAWCSLAQLYWKNTSVYAANWASISWSQLRHLYFHCNKHLKGAQEPLFQASYNSWHPAVWGFLKLAITLKPSCSATSDVYTLCDFI